MSILADIAIFYAIAAVVIGGVMACSPKVIVGSQGQPLPHPRLIGFFVFGIFWPVVIFKLLFGRQP